MPCGSRRRCRSCDRRFTTYERYDQGPVYIRKRSGGREPFDRTKLLAGLERAAIKRPMEREQLEAVVDRIVAEVRPRGGTPERRARSASWPCAGCAALDAVAYVRFASVYRKFGDIAEFERGAGAAGCGASAAARAPVRPLAVPSEPRVTLLRYPLRPGEKVVGGRLVASTEGNSESWRRG